MSQNKVIIWQLSVNSFMKYNKIKLFLEVQDTVIDAVGSFEMRIIQYSLFQVWMGLLCRKSNYF